MATVRNELKQPQPYHAWPRGTPQGNSCRGCMPRVIMLLLVSFGEEIVVAGAVTPLRKQLMGATASWQSDAERVHGAVALGHLACENEENQGRFIEGGVVEKLAELLKSEDGLERDCATFSLANILNISYEQVVSDVAEAREVDAVLQIWKLDGQCKHGRGILSQRNSTLTGRRRPAIVAPKKNPKFFFRSAGSSANLQLDNVDDNASAPIDAADTGADDAADNVGDDADNDVDES
eukprot:symbB.v1.2.019448.t1/scaffold1552.1/size220100/6